MTSTIPTPATTLIFVDANVTNFNKLLADLAPNTEVIILDTTQDGLEQITDVLSKRSHINSIQIVSHGADGQLQLGSTTLTSETPNPTIIKATVHGMI